MVVNKNHYLCACEKLCFSQSGLTNHQKICSVAIEAKGNGFDHVKKVELNGVVEVKYTKEIQDFISLAELIAIDANNTMVTGNKSAARRARNRLNDLRHMIPKIRKILLDRIKEKDG